MKVMSNLLVIVKSATIGDGEVGNMKDTVAALQSFEKVIQL